MLSLFVSGAVDALWMTRQFPDKSITPFFGKRRQYSWSHVQGSTSIFYWSCWESCVMLSMNTCTKTREEKSWGEMDMTGPVAWAKRQILAVKNTFVHRQNTPTMAQWSLFSVNPDSQMFVKRIRHTTIHQIPSFLWEVFPKGLQSSTTNKLNWFSVM